MRAEPCLLLALAMLLCGCHAGFSTPDASDGRPQRIVSLDFCADQYVLELVQRQRILAVSPDAGREFSYLRERAAGLPTVRPVAEDVIVLEPDLVVRTYGGGPRAPALFERAGIPVHNVGWAEDIAAILAAVTETAAVLGSPEQGVAVTDHMRRRLAAVRQAATGAEALYMTPAGVTSGPGSLIHEMLIAAGLDNFQARPGWGSIPLERLAYERPDLIAAGFFDSLTNHPHGWSPTRHPVAQRQLRERPLVPVEGAWTACGGWFLMDAVEALATAATALAPSGTAP